MGLHRAFQRAPSPPGQAGRHGTTKARFKQMKRILSIALCGALCAATLAACGGSSSSSTAASAETLTGTAKGFGGDVTATLTVEDGAITACTLTGDDETPEIGGAALVDTAGYLATILAAAQAINSCAAALFCAPGKTGKKARPGGRRFRAGL